MKPRTVALGAILALVAGSVFPTTIGLSTAVTGASDASTTQVSYGILNNQIFECVGVIPVVSTVTGTPASMAANVNVASSAFALCGSGTPTCSNDMWAGQWTIVSATTGIQAVNAYQGTSVKLVNNSGSGTSVHLRCQVGLMTGSCIFVTRLQPTSDPLF